MTSNALVIFTSLSAPSRDKEASPDGQSKLCRNSVFLCRAGEEEEMDALSEALKSVRMTGAIFYHAECTAPWGFRVPHVKDVAHVLAPGTERLVSITW